MLENDSIPEEAKVFIVDQIFGFMSGSDNLQLGLKWIETGKLFKDPSKPLGYMKLPHKFSVINKVFASKEFPLDFKMTLLN